MQPWGQWIMPETWYTLFPALSVCPGVGISQSALETNEFLFVPERKRPIRFYNVILLYLECTTAL